MMKYAKASMETIAGIEIYPLLSLGIFFAFFLAVGWYVLRADKKYIQKMSEMPIDANETTHS